MKIMVSTLNFADLYMCPWENQKLRHYLLSLKITTSTVMKTMLAAYFVSLAIGFKIIKSFLNRHEIKIILLTAFASYFNYSLFTLG